MGRAIALSLLLIVYLPYFAIAESPPDRDYFDESEAQVKVDKALIAKFHIGRIPESLRENNYTMAMDDINFALKYFPNHPTALQYLGVVARLQGKPGVPIAYFERALRLFPKYAVTFAQYGAYLVEIGNIKEGLEKIQKAIDVDPKWAPAYVLLAKAYAKAGDMELSRQAAEQARQLGYQGKIE